MLIKELDPVWIDHSASRWYQAVSKLLLCCALITLVVDKPALHSYANSRITTALKGTSVSLGHLCQIFILNEESSIVFSFQKAF